MDKQKNLNDIMTKFNNFWINGQKKDAEIVIKRALRIYPKMHQLWTYRGIVCASLEKFEEAKKSFCKAIELNPNSPENFTNLGNVLLSTQRYEKAIKQFEISLVKKFDMNAVKGLVQSSLAIEDFDGVILKLEESKDTTPVNQEIHILLGDVYLAKGEIDLAEQSYREGLELELQKNIAETKSAKKLVQLYLQEEKYEIANALCDKLLHRDKRDIVVLNFKGIILQESDQHEAAIKHFNQMIQTDHYNSLTHQFLGACYVDIGELTQAIDAFNQSLSINPNNPTVKTLKAQCNLGLGKFNEGWKDYEFRFDCPPPLWTSKKLDSKIIEWRGDRCKNLLVWAEQGIGDEIMYLSLVSDLKNYCNKLTVICDRRLHKVLRRSFGPFVSTMDKDKFLSTGKKIGHNPNYSDYQIPMASVCKFLRPDLQSFQSAQHGYFVACAKEVIKWAPIVRDDKSRVIGVSWKSLNPMIGKKKSVDPIELLTSLNGDNVKFVNLQYGNTDAEQAVFRDKNINFQTLYGLDAHNDLEAMLAVISLCDEIVTVSNVTAHLAGSIGKKSSVLLSEKTDWRWQIKGYSSCWYANTQLYRKSKFETWDNMFKQLKLDMEIE